MRLVITAGYFAENNVIRVKDFISTLVETVSNKSSEVLMLPLVVRPTTTKKTESFQNTLNNKL